MPQPWKLRAAALLSLPALTGSALLSGSALAPAAASPGPAPSGRHHGQQLGSHQKGTWKRPGASLRTAPARLLAKAPGHGPVRVTTIRDVDGHPRVSVTTRRTPSGARAAVAAAQQAPGAVAVSVDSRVHTEVLQSNDTDRPVQWALDRLHAESLWTRQPGDGVVVAVVDTGVDAAHPDLNGVVLPGTDLVTSGGDGTTDGNGHGTHVAGIIAAVANNHQGVAGLAQGVNILPVRVLDNTGAGWSSTIAQGIIWATDHGAAVINLSLGGPGSDSVTAAAVQYAEDHNVVVVAAAGNDRANGDPTTYPAAYPGVLGVAASDDQNRIASFSNTGSYVDLAAPGVHIASTYPPADYYFMDGTSMATPYVSASAALLKAADPQLTPAEATQELESTADDLAPAGRDDASGYGLVDPAAALCALTGCTTGTSTTAPPATDAPTSTPQPTDAPPISQPAATATRLSPGPRTIRYGRLAHGRVRVLDQATGRGLADAPVQLCTVVAGDDPRCQTASTDAHGLLGYRLRIVGDVTLYAVYSGSDSSASSRSRKEAYTIRPVLRVRVDRHRITTVVRPAAGQVLQLQQRHGHRWVYVEGRRADARGLAVFARLPRGRFRVRLRQSPSHAAATSRARLVR